MNEPSTQSGDESKSLDVESTAALLESRAVSREASQQPEEETAQPIEASEELPESIGDIDNDEEIEAADNSTDETEEVDAEEQSESTSFQNLTEVAEAAGMSLDDFMSTIKLTTKVNGEEAEKSISELVKGYQLESGFTQKNQAFIEKQKQDEADLVAARAEITANMKKTGHAFQMAQNQLTHEFNAINWNELKSTDPTQFMLKRQQFGERQASMNQQIEQATRQAQEFTTQQNELTEQNRATNIQKQTDLLLEAVPEWKDAKTRTEGEKDITEHLLSRGFTSADADLFIDHRLTLLVRDAMKSSKVSTAVEIAKKKVNKIPKLVKGNARQNQNSSNAKKVSKLESRFKSTGSTDDLAALLNSRRA